MGTTIHSCLPVGRCTCWWVGITRIASVPRLVARIVGFGPKSEPFFPIQIFISLFIGCWESLSMLGASHNYIINIPVSSHDSSNCWFQSAWTIGPSSNGLIGIELVPCKNIQLSHFNRSWLAIISQVIFNASHSRCIFFLICSKPQGSVCKFCRWWWQACHWL